MDRTELLKLYWRDVAAQDAMALKTYFAPHASICWNNTNEKFTVEEFIAANCEYPGSWQGEMERIEVLGDTVITVTRVWLADNSVSFHAVSFFEFKEERIITLSEYWGDDGVAPQWRMDKHIGVPIK